MFDSNKNVPQFMNRAKDISIVSSHRILDSNSLDIFLVNNNIDVNKLHIIERIMDHPKCSCMSITFFNIEY
jgi:hypothetical protein